MRWRLAVQGSALVGVGLMSGCVTYDQGAQAVVQRMAQEYNCPDEMAVTSYAAGGYRVTGCGYTANYDCSYGNGSVTCVKEAGSSPVPSALPAPPPVGDAGTQ